MFVHLLHSHALAVLKHGLTLFDLLMRDESEAPPLELG
jgi:hypothetical protein